MKSIFCIVYQDCCASWTTPASATLVRKAPTVTPTPSAEITSVPAHLDTSARPAIRMSTSAHWVKVALFDLLSGFKSEWLRTHFNFFRLKELLNYHTCIHNYFIQVTGQVHSFLLLWVLWYPIIVPVIAVNNTFRGVIVKALVWLQTTLKSPIIVMS